MAKTRSERCHSTLLRPWLVQLSHLSCNWLNGLKLSISGPIEKPTITQRHIIDHFICASSLMPGFARGSSGAIISACRWDKSRRWTLREDDKKLVLAGQSLLLVVVIAGRRSGPALPGRVAAVLDDCARSCPAISLFH